MSWLLPSAVAVPLLAAGLTVLVGKRLIAQRLIASTGVTFTFGAAVALLIEADRGAPIVAQAGGWAAPTGITLIARPEYLDKNPETVRKMTRAIRKSVEWARAKKLLRPREA